MKIKYLLKPKYIVMRGAYIYNRGVFFIIKPDYEKSEPYVLYDKISKQSFYISNIFKKLYTFKQLMYYGRFLAPSRVKSLTWTVLKFDSKKNYHV